MIAIIAVVVVVCWREEKSVFNKVNSFLPAT